MHASLLYLTVLIIATSGLVYELLAGTLASYVLGDSVTQFSTTIGAYLFAMGLGSYLSRFVKTDVARRFLEIELAAAIVGGLSAPMLFLAFAYAESFRVVLYVVVLAIGTLVGLEVPLLMRILRDHLAFEELVARVLTFDYIGALVGSLLFAIVLVPGLGLERTSLLFGILNAAVGFGGTWAMRDLLTASDRRRIRIGGAAIVLLLSVAFVQAETVAAHAEQRFYPDPIVYVDQTPYQRIVLTHGELGTQLFLNGNLQLSSTDEHRYHEALVHPAFAAARRRARVLVLGGGDGLAVREVLRYPSVETVTLVDLDEGMTRMARTRRVMRELNHGSLDDGRVTVVHDDAMAWLDPSQPERGRARPEPPYDVVIIDFPDPNNFSLGKLYTRRFYELVRGVVDRGSVVVVQATSPLYARRSFWCIERTLREAGFTTRPYHATVPSFGEWGFVLAGAGELEAPATLAIDDLRYLDDATLRTLFVFPHDMARVDVAANHLNDQQLVRYYLGEWN